MKGPSGRLKFRVRRHWECPRCHRVCWTGGDVVTRPCEACTTVNPPRIFWMRLVEKPSTTPRAANAHKPPGPEAPAPGHEPAASELPMP